MDLYRSKPCFCRALQFKGHNANQIPGVWEDAETGRHFVRTAHKQIVFLEIDDYVVAEPTGDGYYPVKPEVFALRWDGPIAADAGAEPSAVAAQS